MFENQQQVHEPQKEDSPPSPKKLSASSSFHPVDIIQRVRINPQSFTPTDAMMLQRTIGNQAVIRLMEDVELMKAISKPLQKNSLPVNDESLHNNSEVAQKAGKTTEGKEAIQMKKENKTGLPDNLKAGIESLSGMDMSNVRVNYNSEKPAQVSALAYTQGTDIYVAQGQEAHLPHEAWHVVQQANGRVQPTLQMKDVAVNDDVGLEREADEMGAKASRNTYIQSETLTQRKQLINSTIQQVAVIQRREISEIEKSLDTQLSAVSGTNHISEGAQVNTITARQELLASFQEDITSLAQEVADKGGENVTELTKLDNRVVEIKQKEKELTADISAGEKTAPPKPTGWGGNLAAYQSWEKKNKNLKTNKAELVKIGTERETLTGKRPISVLKYKLTQIQDKLTALKKNLNEAEKWRYFYLLMTTVTPSKKEYKFEGDWQNGASALGVFTFAGAESIEGIPNGIDSVEVHIHFKSGTKQINKAHIRGGFGADTDLYSSGQYKQWYAKTALDACKSVISSELV